MAAMSRRRIRKIVWGSCCVRCESGRMYCTSVAQLDEGAGRRQRAALPSLKSALVHEAKAIRAIGRSMMAGGGPGRLGLSWGPGRSAQHEGHRHDQRGWQRTEEQAEWRYAIREKALEQRLAGGGALTMTVSPPPVTSPATTAVADRRSDPRDGAAEAFCDAADVWRGGLSARPARRRGPRAWQKGLDGAATGRTFARQKGSPPALGWEVSQW